MAYPEDPLPVVIEFWDGSQWVDITGYTFARRGGGIEIERGFPDEGREPEPSRATLTLDNRDGRFSPRNPGGPYYGKIGRNTPLRVRIDGGIAGDSYLDITALHPSHPFTADHSSLGITGDIDIRIDVAVRRASKGAVLAAKFETSGNQRSWAWLLNTDGTMTFTWSADGSSTLSSTSAAVDFADGQRVGLRVTLDVDNGGNHTVTFYTADTIDGPWSVLGSPDTASGTTSIFASSAVLELVRSPAFFSTHDWQGLSRVYAFELRDGINGTVVADPDFRDKRSDVTSFDDDAGRTWTGTRFRIVDPSQRYIGEAVEWPTRWDVSGTDVETRLTAQGILRRLRQGEKPARSSMRFEISRDAGLVAYWPMENEPGPFASPIPGVAPMRYTGAKPGWGEAAGNAGIGPLLGSDKIAVLGSTTRLTGVVPSHTTQSSLAVMAVMDVPPTTGWADNTPILHINQSGSTVSTWEIRYKSGSGGDLQVRALDAAGSELDASGTINVNIDGQQFILTFTASEVGGGTLWSLLVETLGDDGMLQSAGASGLFASIVPATATQIMVAPEGGLAELAVGHVAVKADGTAFIFPPDTLGIAPLSYAGENAADRAIRIVRFEANTTLRLISTVDGEDDTPLMGAQAIPTTIVDALNETWLADQGLLFETRDELGLTFRTRRSLYSQPVAVTLDYTAGGEVAPDLEPVDDDQNVRNDVTVQRKNGTFARAVDSTSRLSVQDPPDGVGRYEEQVEVNLYSDDQLEQHAYWRLHLGTWDEARFPRVTINMAALAAAGKTDLIANICALDVGDRIQIGNLPIWAGTIDGVADLLVLGYSEQIGHPTEWTITLNCVPAGPYNIARYAASTATVADNPSRYQILGCTTRAAFDTTTDSVLQVNTPKGEFTSDPTFLPFVIESAGVVMEVSAVSGSGAAQDLTVTVLNGVSKTIPTGSTVLLHRAARYGL